MRVILKKSIKSSSLIISLTQITQRERGKVEYSNKNIHLIVEYLIHSYRERPTTSKKSENFSKFQKKEIKKSKKTTSLTQKSHREREIEREIWNFKRERERK